MDSAALYSKTSYEIAELLTKRYSTSFSLSSRLFGADIRPHIHAIYGMVRLADEIVDSYRGDDAAAQLDAFHGEVIDVINAGYSTNPLLHAFGLTARAYSIDDTLIGPFFESMKTDLTAKIFDQEAYDRYIYGSAEAIGLMCLQVFVNGEAVLYGELKDGAQRLGAAYQKVNFLRDMKADYEELGRVYFPGVEYAAFDEIAKKNIVRDIKADFAAAEPMIRRLPKSSRKAVRASYYYYRELLSIEERSPLNVLQQRRVRVPDWKKLALLIRAQIGL